MIHWYLKISWIKEIKIENIPEIEYLKPENSWKRSRHSFSTEYLTLDSFTEFSNLKLKNELRKRAAYCTGKNLPVCTASQRLDENHNPSQHNDWQDEAYFFDTYFLVENCVCVSDLIKWLADLYVQYVVVTYATLVNFCV